MLGLWPAYWRCSPRALEQLSQFVEDGRIKASSKIEMPWATWIGMHFMIHPRWQSRALDPRLTPWQTAPVNNRVNYESVDENPVLRTRWPHSCRVDRGRSASWPWRAPGSETGYLVTVRSLPCRHLVSGPAAAPVWDYLEPILSRAHLLGLAFRNLVHLRLRCRPPCTVLGISAPMCRPPCTVLGTSRRLGFENSFDLLSNFRTAGSFSLESGTILLAAALPRRGDPGLRSSRRRSQCSGATQNQPATRG